MNIYEPTEDDILTWAYSADPKWPASDWDFYVLCGPHDSLVIKLANDENCPKNKFFLHALYYFVGDTFNRSAISQDRIDRIKRMLLLVGDDSSQDVLIWKKSVQQLLTSELKFDPEKWLHFLFNP